MTLLAPAGVRAVVLDVEGTTTPIAFVHDVLFPFARAAAPDFIHAHGTARTVAGALDLLRREREVDVADGNEPPPDPVAYVLWLMDRDRKSTGLKQLQGAIWQQGYAEGRLRGVVYPDVEPAFARWREQGRDIAIYSSGSVLAQQLLFSTTGSGDLTVHIRAHFDTETGAKQSPDSYRAIASALAIGAGEILFLSDVAGELDAARAAGLATALVARDGDPGASGDHPVVATLDPVLPGVSAADRT